MTKEEFLNKFMKVSVEEYPNAVSENPLVSVLVITYQHVNYIRECLDGILMQKTNFPFEVLVGDDDSTDGTRDICLEYANRFPNKIKLFLHSRKNNISIDGHASWHFNSIYNRFEAKGKYFAICEGDDYWSDSLKLQKQIDFLEANSGFSACAHLSDVTFHRAEKINLERFKKKPKKTIFKTNDLLDFTRFHTSSLVFRRNLINFNLMNESQLFNLNRDHPIMILLSAQGSIKRIPEVMSVYRRNEGGVSENINYQRIFKSNIMTIDALSELIPGFKFKSYYMKGNWYRYLIDKPMDSKIKKFKYFLYFAISSFYIFPKNGNKIVRTIKLLFKQ